MYVLYSPVAVSLYILSSVDFLVGIRVAELTLKLKAESNVLVVTHTAKLG